MSTVFPSAPEILLSGAAFREPLARLRFGRRSAGGEAATFALPLERLAGAEAEHWCAAGPLQDLPAEPGLRLRRSADFLFGQFSLPPAQTLDMERAAFLTYRRLQELLREQGFEHLLRAWNYFGEVTAGDGDGERYRRFCVGRFEALYAPGFEHSLSAATVIGSFTPGFELTFLAARRPGLAVENPRQVSAYRYPREYSPRAPSFARATLFNRLLLVSGTASVVGHATQHPYDAAAQLRETVANLQALLSHARQQHFAGEEGFRWQPRALRLYARDADQAIRLQTQTLALLGADTPLAVLHGEICRRDLEVEIEGVYEALA